jgi:hypothetical protein
MPYWVVLIVFQTFPDPQPDLIDRWQGYLTESMVRSGKNYSDKELEKRWQDHLKKEANFHRLPQVFDEEIIRCWEACLSNVGTTSGESGSEEEDSDNEDDNVGPQR